MRPTIKVFVALCTFSLGTLVLLTSSLVPEHGAISTHFLRHPRRHIADATRAYVSRLLAPARYASLATAGCNFGPTVAAFDPFDLPLHCGNMHELKTHEELGKGFWRSVLKATWEGKPVAVKVVHQSLAWRHNILERHVEEAAVLYQLRNAPHIAHLVGWCNTTIVVEYFPRNLDEVLRDATTPVWSMTETLSLARDAAMGVAELHAVGAVHVDLQPRQFLYDAASHRLVLNDFNRLRYGGRNTSSVNDVCEFHVTIAKGFYRAPEEYLLQPLSAKVDVYSLALVFWSLVAREAPYKAWSRDDVYAKVPDGLRPDLAVLAQYPQAMQDLVQTMWAADPSQRPSAADVATQVEAILAQVERDPIAMS
ncbi:TKL protein kinase [Saprolegnia parasitica CBS 223.65]|uniref:TKL protein kinase n=1 Tax=Saprolegnia parasitica (strain CBS 223.65) TaxID=695850 RepID=A0A067C7A4_SAPPC|nr:TKL protein kinase [Saprolegnia parasitica CBS 223.65]KDO26639.1 TKL protein kinase [Saprolegnia parasitica CBS 223.65]|eukprot:XP_012202778.1 TKL protein kinase [Saprolegnia parasitica CBS 223.65]